MKRLFKSKTR